MFKQGLKNVVKKELINNHRPSIYMQGLKNVASKELINKQNLVTPSESLFHLFDEVVEVPGTQRGQHFNKSVSGYVPRVPKATLQALTHLH